MFIFRDIVSLQAYLDEQRRNKKTIGFTPTMGALHRGHVSLLEHSNNECDCSVVSIFVNPTQFNQAADLASYPKPLDDDIQKLYENGCDVAFVPSVADVYPNGTSTPEEIDFEGLDERMEGQFRSGHFAGVAQVMHRLLDLIQPDKLYMGQKDFQQTAIVRHVIKHFSLNVTFVTCPTVREADGLAMSSRNLLLDPELRPKCNLIYQLLTAASDDIRTSSIESICGNAMAKLSEIGFEPEYFEIVDGNTLRPIENVSDHNFIIACCAVAVGEVRLIDNMILKETD